MNDSLQKIIDYARNEAEVACMHHARYEHLEEIASRLEALQGEPVATTSVISRGKVNWLITPPIERMNLYAAPPQQGEPVAWMHEDPNRVDVIHTKVKKLLNDAGHFHRPLDKTEKYTIPLYAAPQQGEPAPVDSPLTCLSCDHWESCGELSIFGFCTVFAKATEKYHGEKCTAHSGLVVGDRLADAANRKFRAEGL